MLSPNYVATPTKSLPMAAILNLAENVKNSQTNISHLVNCKIFKFEKSIKINEGAKLCQNFLKLYARPLYKK